MELSIEAVLLQLFFLFLLAKLFGLVCERLGVSAVIGEISAGILVATTIPLSFLGLGPDISLFNILGLDQDISFFEILSELGVIFLLFAVGLETPFSELRKVGVTATIVAVLGVILPFFAGFTLILGFGHGQTEALFIGAAMVATSVGITARVISDMSLTQSVEARVIIGAAVIDDVLGMIVLAIVVGIASGGNTGILDIILVSASGIVFVLAVIFVGSIMMPHARRRVEDRKNRKMGVSQEDDVLCVEKKKPMRSSLPLALLVCFGLSFLASYVGLAAIIGAFLAGMAFAEFKDKWPCERGFDSINEFLVPFFFIYTGMLVDISSFGGVLFLAILVTILAVVTKVVGCGLGSLKMGKKTSTIIGVGMIPRGEVGIIVASIGFGLQVVSQDMFSVVVFMSMATTIIAPFLLTWAFRRKYGECKLPEESA